MVIVKEERQIDAVGIRFIIFRMEGDSAFVESPYCIMKNTINTHKTRA